MARSLNKAQLIGNLTRDPELRYTPQGTAVCSFGLATNRAWTTDDGTKHEEAEFHRVVAWNKLAELCAQLLFKGRKVYIEGRLQTRQWTGQDGIQRKTTEVVASDMIILDSRREAEATRVETGTATAEKTVKAGEETFEEEAKVEPVEEKTPVGEGEKTAEEVVGEVPSGTKPVNDQGTDDEKNGKKKKTGKNIEREEEGENPESGEITKKDIPF